MKNNIVITLPNSNRNQLKHLEKYLRSKGSFIINEIGFEEKKTKNAELAVGGFTDSLIAIVNALNEPLVELVKCLQEYIKLFKTEIHLEIKEGEDYRKISLNGKNTAEVEKIILSLLQSKTESDKK